MSVVGFVESPETEWDSTRETIRWIGRPWRRVAMVTHRYFYKGEQVGQDRDLTFHLGLRRLGLGVTFSVIKADVLDYSDEPNQ